MRINEECYFAEGGRTDGVRLQKEFRTNCPFDNYNALHGILTKLGTALTAASEDPATMTINAAVTFLETEANVLKVVAEW